MARYFNRFSPPPVTKGEVIPGESVVEITTYVDQNKLVESMFRAGQTLAEIRGQVYDYPAGDPIDSADIPIPISRAKDFDLIELGKLRDSASPVFQHLLDEQTEADLSTRKSKRSSSKSKTQEDFQSSDVAVSEPPVISEPNES